MIDGITFLGKHSYKDFGITIKERKIGYPEPQYVIETIPYANGYFDFTEIFGNAIYKDRTIIYVFNILSENPNIKANEITNWLMGSSRNKLYDDSEKGFYFEAQAQSWEFERKSSLLGELTVTFLTYPLKIRSTFDGNTDWDDFVFSTDTLQQTKFTINNEEKEIELINNSSVKINPFINCDTDTVSIILEDKTEIKIKKSSNSKTYYYLFELERGLNRFKIKGTGNIEFIIRNEVL